jgi:hypothetical protein
LWGFKILAKEALSQLIMPFGDLTGVVSTGMIKSLGRFSIKSENFI